MDLVQQIIIAIVVGLLVALAVFYLQTTPLKKSATSKPTFLILGINNSGKTNLLYKLLQSEDEVNEKIVTVSSIEQNSAAIPVPFSQESIAKPIQFIDYPGHMKYFNLLNELINDIGLTKIKGIIFVIDSSSINFNLSLHLISKYLFNLLSITERTPGGINFLFAVNKSDLFDSLPPTKILSSLESELNKLIQNELTSIDKNQDSELANSETLTEFWLSVLGSSENKFNFDILEGNMDFQSGSILKNKIDSWKNWIDERVVN